jgi:hypothetical protein
MADIDGANALLEAGQSAPTRGRPRRAEAEPRQRRRRGGGGADNSALAVSDEIKRELAAKGLEGRWINDIGMRMTQKTKHDDWDVVDGVEPVVVGVDNRTGQQVKAYYCAKPTEFLQEDRKRRIVDIDNRERAIISGNDHGEMDEGAYNPLGTTNSIRRSG